MIIRLSAAIIIFAISNAPAQSIWVEGESADSKSIQNNSWYSSVKREDLSGGRLIAHWGNRIGTASYTVNVPKAGKYVLWLRANPTSSQLNVNFDSSEWFNVNFKRYSHEQLNVARDGKPDLRFIAWVRAGVRTFDAGEHQIGIRFTSSNNHHGMLDCLCLTTDTDWKPNRISKPGESRSHWPAPEVTNTNLDQWLEFIRPSTEELGWRNIRWHHSLSKAAAEAKKLNRPILLWAMNGHPCGET